MRRIALLLPFLLLPFLLLAGCKTMELKESMFIRPDSVTQAKPLAKQNFADATELEIQRPDGAVLRGVLVTRPDAERTLLYFGGNLFHLDEYGPNVVSHLKGCKVNVAIFDYRGYGRSTGAPTVANLSGDALAIYDMLEARYPGKVSVHGQSLGSFVAAGIAQQRPVRSVVLETTATTPLDIAQSALPWYYKAFVKLSVEPSLSVIDNEAAAKRFQSPTLVLAGARDKTTPAFLGRRVYEAAPVERKQLLVLPEAGHNNVLSNPSTAPALCPFIEG